MNTFSVPRSAACAALLAVAAVHGASAQIQQRPTGLDSRAAVSRPLPPPGTVPSARVTPRRDLAALNPQPLPPVERGRATAGADRGVRPNAIIIVGGKPTR